MEILPCSAIPPRTPVAPQTNYEKAYTAALHQDVTLKKKLKRFKSRTTSKKSSEIILNGLPPVDLEATLESAVANNELV